MKQWICSPCGSRLGRIKKDHVATWHPGKCDYCNQKQYITEPRDFGIKTSSEGADLMDLFNKLLP